ncbi:MAG TPA: hypothetical protein VK007_13715 [Acidimicrobiales bacterium]|nr:hypothetical protein [Acidimicrobiales bacterium]
MLLPQRLWPGIEDGSVTVAFRRWRRPTVKAGGTLQTPAGLLAIEAVEPIEPDDITDADARRAGAADREAAIAELRPEGTLYRIRFRRLGEDPRVALRNQAELTTEDVDELRRRFRRLPWARPVLELIEAHPATVSTELAEQLGMERLRFKERVRRLKALGLTESLEVGYRLSPRGQAFLDELRRLDEERAQHRVER